MWSLQLIVLTLSGSSTIAFCRSHIPHVPHGVTSSPLTSRTYVTDATRLDSYDFVIAGGGLSGLVLASRLSEDANTTVLVIEAGGTGEDIPSLINIPANTYYNSVLGTSYDWAYTTAPQKGANNRNMNWPRGKILGGSSAINGMYLVRPSDVEVNKWRDLIASDDTTTADSWGWDQFFSAMKKSETFTPPLDDPKATAGIQWDTNQHGTSGPIHATYPAYMVPIVGKWLPTLANLGVPSTEEANGGHTMGAFITPSNINPSNWTRSYSKSGYIDPLPPRSNLHILPSNTVTRILFDTTSSSNGLKATSVEYSPGAGQAKQQVNVNKEVLLAGGVIGSAQMLMVSGVGPKDVLNAAGVEVKLALPGVGQHVQDHLAAGISWQTDKDTQGTIEQSGSDFSKSAEFLSFINSATAYINGTTLLGSDGVSALQNSISAGLPDSVASLIPSDDPNVIEGYKTIYNTVAETFINGDVGLIEILFSINVPGGVTVQAALQHPLSQGRIYITSSSIFDPPIIDPQYFSHSADVVIMREGLKFARRVGQTSPLKDILGAEVVPGSSVNTDDEWDAWLKGQSNTEFHPSSSCAMLPLVQGGVVNASLQVYGLANVRVVDASVYPINFASHLGGPTYGLAEQAASIIRATYKVDPITATQASSSAINNVQQTQTASVNFANRSSAISLTFVVGAFVGIVSFMAMRL